MKKDNPRQTKGTGWHTTILSPPGSRFIWLVILTILILSFFDLIGWITDRSPASLLSSWNISMQMATSLCFIISATALAFIHNSKPGTLNSIVPKILGLTVVLAGLVSAIYYVRILMTGNEPSFLYNPLTSFILNEANRMSFLTAVNFILIGCILILLAIRNTWSSNTAHIIIIPLVIISYMVPVSYILGVQNFHGFLGMPAALNSGIAFCVFCLAILFIRPETWLMRIFYGSLSGSAMARRLLPGVFLLPIIIGWLRIKGEHLGVFDSEVGVMLVALTYTICFLAIVWFVARTVNRQELKRKMFEKELAASESNLKAIFDATKESIYVFDIHGVILTANITAANRLQYSVPEITGRHFSEFLPEQLSQTRSEKMNYVVETGKPLQFEDERDGISFQHNFYPVFENDKVTRIVTYSVDITERHLLDEELKARELKFRNIFESSNDAIIITDIDTQRYIDCNKMAETITGYSRNEILSMKVGSLLKPTAAEEAKYYFDKLKNGETVRSETELFSGDGKVIPVEFSASMGIIDKRMCIISLIRDISKRKKAEEKLKNYARDLKRLIATKDKFFKIIAHDLKNPFSSLLTTSEMLAKNAQALSLAKIITYCEVINNSAKNGYELLENLLEWSKTQTGDIEFQPEMISLKDIVERNILSFKISAMNKNISLESQVTDDFQLFGDKNMIDTIIRNLLGNALKFTHPQGMITISAGRNDRMDFVTVRDTGIGIDKVNMNKLFKIEAKFVNVGTANERGTGLGLLLCKEFAEKHRGRIRVESVPGKGSSFIIELPQKKEASVTEAVAIKLN